MADPIGNRMNAEERRISWRRHLLSTLAGLVWLTEQAVAGTRERDLGPHRQDAPKEAQ
jgi:hypothetical protein